MYRNEAIRVIEELLADRDNDSTYPCVSSPRHYEALDLAIEALQEPIEEVDYCNNCPYISWDKDCISRQDAIEALTGWETEPLDEDIVRTLEALPPVPQKQVTSKLKNPCDSLLKPDSDECKEQKSKLDCISRQQAVEDIKKHADTITDALIILENFPLATPTVSEDCISRRKAIETCDRMYPKIDRQDIKAVIEATPSVTPTEKTGEWIQSYFNEYCGTDENHSPVFRKTPCVKCDQCGEKRRDEENFCPNCGAKMKGGTENE